MKIGQEHWKYRQQACLRCLVVDEKAQQHRRSSLIDLLCAFLPAASAAAGLHLTFKVTDTDTDSLNAKDALCFKIEGQAYNNKMIGSSI